METQLTIAFQELQAEIGFNLGWGRGALYGEPGWSDEQQGRIDSSTKKGMRRFYFSAKMPNEPATHDWSFLRPTAFIAIAEGETTAPLPADFRALEGTGELLLVTEERCQPIEVVGAGRIRHLYATEPTSTGQPRFVAVEPIKGVTPQAGQRFQLDVFPAAADDYIIQFDYLILPEYLSGAFPYCYGGASHSGTILEACLAANERDMDDQRGIHEAHFMELLAASISADRDLKPQKLGRNLDNSDNYGTRYRRTGFQGQYAAFDHVYYPSGELQ